MGEGMGSGLIWRLVLWYDPRVVEEIKIFTKLFPAIVNPQHFDPKSMVDFRGEMCTIPPNSFALVRTVEYFRIPRNVLTVCLGKSIYARCSIIVNVTPFEPEWEGYATWRYPTQSPCLPRFMPMKVLPSSRQMMNAMYPSRIRRANTKTKNQLWCQNYEAHALC